MPTGPVSHSSGKLACADGTLDPVSAEAPHEDLRVLQSSARSLEASRLQEQSGRSGDRGKGEGQQRTNQPQSGTCSATRVEVTLIASDVRIRANSGLLVSKRLSRISHARLSEMSKIFRPASTKGTGAGMHVYNALALLLRS